MECKLVNLFRGGCPIGKAVGTTHGDAALLEVYDRIIHTTPPFYSHDDDPLRRLASCYREALELVFGYGDIRRVAVPLLGAGARGFPVDEAVSAAVSESLLWRDGEYGEDMDSTLCFGIPDLSIAEKIVREMEAMDNSQ